MNVSRKKHTKESNFSPFFIFSTLYPIVFLVFLFILGYVFMQRSSTVGSIDGIGAAGFGLLYYISINGISAYIVLLSLYVLLSHVTHRTIHKWLVLVFMLLTVPFGLALSIFGLISPLIPVYELFVFG